MPEFEVHSHWVTSSGRDGYAGVSDACFPYWSFTKTAIAIATLKLVEAGALDLDAPLDGQAYSLRQLLAHTSGLPDYGQLEDYHRAVADRQPPWSRKKLLDIVLAKGLLFAPGDGWSYSNVGYMLVRELVEEVTSKPLGTVISDLICQPLGLDSVELATGRPDFARLYWEAAADYDPNWVYHGCLIGTAADAARLLQALFDGALLRPDTLGQMLSRRALGGAIPGRPWTDCGYGLGMMTGEMEGVGKAIGHTGGGPFSVNAVYHFPDLADPVTVASFIDGSDGGAVELEAATRAHGE
ncbi:serine hydrolase domain-containing protein [Algihabitans albus]|uniref:serine hydrolase domain-containing protein n=1 Tax=Algihabitans albus TaxID=2164067 RepID=UPI000E5D450A|nr:serine hydrolase domain-containing protein [Algihabitans albus]